MGKGVVLLVVLALAVGVSEAGAAVPRDRDLLAYAQLWAKADHFYGAEGQPAPFVEVGPTDYEAEVTITATNGRAVLAEPRLFAMLRSRKFTPRWLAINAFVHEWVHIYQERFLGWRFERAAKIFAGNRTWRLVPQRLTPRWRHHKPLPHGIARGQFGSNWGADPQTIPWPFVEPN